MRRRISVAMTVSGSIILILSMLLSTVAFASNNNPQLPKDVGSACHYKTCDDGNPCTSNDQQECEWSNWHCSVTTPSWCNWGQYYCQYGWGCGGTWHRDETCLPCTGTPNTASCDDGDACTYPDACDGQGACVGGAPVTCDDLNACTDDACNPQTGQCVYTNDDTNSCSDGNACTTGEVCSGGACVGGTPVTCDDLNACTDDACNPQTGQCVYTNDDTNSCSDGDVCTDPDVCASGTCTPGTWVCGECQTNADCTDDLVVCNGWLVCVDHSCVPLLPSCDDGIDCTVDACVEGLQVDSLSTLGFPGYSCTHTPDNLLCDDQDICTVDVCVPPVQLAGDAGAENTAEACQHTGVGPRICGTDEGDCSKGIQSCANNQWGSCEGGFGPGTEVCDGRDNNCNGLIDEGDCCGPTPEPTPVIEIKGTERLPETGEMPMLPTFPTLQMMFSSLALIGGGLLLRRGK